MILKFIKFHASSVSSASSSESPAASLSGMWSYKYWATNLTDPCIVKMALLLLFSYFFINAKIASFRRVPKVLLKNFLTGIFSWSSLFSISSKRFWNIRSFEHDSILSFISLSLLCSFLIFLTNISISFLNNLCPSVSSFLSAGSNLTLTRFVYCLSRSMNTYLEPASHLSSLCSWNFSFSKVLLILRVCPINLRPFELTYPKVTILMFLLALHASKILRRPSSSRKTFLKFNFSTGWSALAIKASPIKIPVFDFKSVFLEKLSLVIFLAPGLQRASFKYKAD